eukprot:364308-Chlamydomonas_euryale.AAC.1
MVQAHKDARASSPPVRWYRRTRTLVLPLPQASCQFKRHTPHVLRPPKVAQAPLSGTILGASAAPVYSLPSWSVDSTSQPLPSQRPSTPPIPGPLLTPHLRQQFVLEALAQLRFVRRSGRLRPAVGLSNLRAACTCDVARASCRRGWEASGGQGVP